jgi:hypothetical protein
MPQYNGVWTIEAAAQAQSNQQWVTDPNFKNTTLLLQADGVGNGFQNNTFLDSSSNGFSVTRNGNTTQGSFTPFSQIPGQWNNYFDGGSYIYSATNSAFSLASSAFTIETWIYCNAVDNYRPTLNTYVNSSSGWSLTIYNGLLYFNASGDGADIAGTTPIVPGRWYHIAVSGTAGTSVKMFVNGVQDGFTYTGNIVDSSGSLLVGALAGSYFSGYMSNARVVKGTALYTTNFTPPTSPLTAITNTSWLSCQSNRFVDNSTNNFAILVGAGTPAVQPFSPFAPQFQWTPAVIGGSGYFDGSGDYLNIADNAALEPGSGNFTLECWFYATATPPTFGSTILAKSATSSYGPFLIIIDPSTRYLYGYCSSTGSSWNIVTNNTTVTALNTWYHVALVRSGSNFAMFVNGVRAPTTATSSATLINNTDPFAVGYANYSSTFFSGYVSSVRYVVGTAVYDPTLTTCTVPTAPLTAVSNTQVLCNFTNAGIYDAAMDNVLETVGNAQVSTSVVKYGSGSIAFDGTGDCLAIPADAKPNLHFGSADFTIEFWAWKSANGSTDYDTVISIGSNGNFNGGFSVELSATRGFCFIYDANIRIQSIFNPNDAAWHHYAVVRNNNVFALYRDGVQLTTAVLTPTLGITGNAVVGAAVNSTFTNFNGYIDDLRVTKGVARYTANFIPPLVALPRQ